MQEQYDKSVEQREGLKDKKVLTALRLQRAAILDSALAEEKVFHACQVERCLKHHKYTRTKK